VDRTIDRVTTIPTSSPGSKAPQDAEEILKFGGEGTGAGKFKDNRSVAVGAGGWIYSADYSGGRVQIFDAVGTFQNQWTADAGMYLLDMAADRKGNVYVAHSQGIMVFGADGGAPVQKANYYIQGMALTLDGRVVISINRGITILDANLKPVQEIKNAAESASAKSGFREIAVDGNNNIYALDAQNGDILKFAPDGKFLNRTPSNSRSPQDIAIDPRGRIFVSDVSSISAFDENGKFLKTFKATQAFGMAFNDAGELFVASRPFVVKYKLNF
jgi:outer membrane protein assembly factor BamB